MPEPARVPGEQENAPELPEEIAVTEVQQRQRLIKAQRKKKSSTGRTTALTAVSAERGEEIVTILLTYQETLLSQARRLARRDTNKQWEA